MTDPAPNRATMLVLAYLWPLAVVPLLVSRDDAEVHWHAKHGLVLMAAELLAVLLLSILASLMTMMAFGVGLALSVLLYILLWATILIVHVLAIVKALGGSRLEVPAVSRYAARF
ncbi:MAG: hypothetical protein GEU82_17790 [Luteitalea sp.]|nr:hypothetical protein [Luteitalea sp.]